MLRSPEPSHSPAGGGSQASLTLAALRLATPLQPGCRRPRGQPLRPWQLRCSPWRTRGSADGLARCGAASRRSRRRRLIVREPVGLCLFVFTVLVCRLVLIGIVYASGSMQQPNSPPLDCKSTRGNVLVLAHQTSGTPSDASSRLAIEAGARTSTWPSGQSSTPLSPHTHKQLLPKLFILIACLGFRTQLDFPVFSLIRLCPAVLCFRGCFPGGRCITV